MQNKKILTLVFLVFIHFCQAQEFLVMKDGAKVEFKKMKQRENFIVVTLVSGETKEVLFKDVDCFVNTGKEEELFWRPSSSSSGLDYGIGTDYLKVKKLIDGKIKVYEYYTTTGMPGQGGSSSRTLTIEKGNSYHEIPNGGLLSQSKTERVIVLRKFVSDNNSIAKEIETLESVKLDEFFKFVQKYNVEEFDKARPVRDNSKFTNVVILTKEKIESDSYLLINDSSQYNINSSTIASVRLPQEQQSKICLIQSKEKFCDIIQPSKFFINFLELSIPSSQFIRFERLKQSDGQRAIQFILSKRK